MYLSSMNFGLGDEIEQLRETVHRFAQEKIAPLAEEIEQSNQFPPYLWQEMGALGLLGMTADPDFGGTGMGYLARAVAMEEISRASASVGLSYGATPICASTRSTAGAMTNRSSAICRNCVPAKMSVHWRCPNRAPAPTWC